VHIFIDESGSFQPAPPARPRFCAVVALTIRSQLVPQFSERLKTLRAGWGSVENEVKGSALNERQMAEALRTFDTYDITAFAAVVDTGLHPPERIHAYRQKAEASLLNGLTPQHNDNARAFVGGLVERLRALSDQLALQVYTMMVPVERLIREMPTYYATRAPSEVGSFHWTLDAKSDRGITAAETYWRQLVCPFLQTNFITEPGIAVKGFNYSAYDASYCTKYTELPDYLREHLPTGKPINGRVSDLGKLMLEHLRFETSKENAGLQAADIVASALTRALNGTLQIDGWRDLGRLFIRRNSKPPVSVVQFSDDDDGRPAKVAPPVAVVLRTLNSSAKSMWPS